MKELQRGMLLALPLVPGVISFGLLYGVMARQVGFSPWEAWAMSLIVHAGSAQFAVLRMWDTTGAFSIILTTLTINLRHLLMGASLAPYLSKLSMRWKAFLALWMSDESYAVAIDAYEKCWGSQWVFLGANISVYLSWTMSGLVGAALGEAIPDPGRYGLDPIFPLAILAHNRDTPVVVQTSHQKVGQFLDKAYITSGAWRMMFPMRQKTTSRQRSLPGRLYGQALG